MFQECLPTGVKSLDTLEVKFDTAFAIGQSNFQKFIERQIALVFRWMTHNWNLGVRSVGGVVSSQYYISLQHHDLVCKQVVFI